MESFYKNVSKIRSVSFICENFDRKKWITVKISSSKILEWLTF